ncbi:MAG: hypothetical protein R3178_09060 [Rhodothermales bacterium]|nr:hypothetical protein [Rhodothermales bacterium]
MAHRIRGVKYFYATVKDEPGEGYRVLSLLSDLGVNLLAFTAIPVGPTRTQFTIFPEDAGKLTVEAQKAGLALDGPHTAILVQGDDELGALANIHRRLYDIGISVFASSGVTDGKGSYGYVLYVKPDDFSAAVDKLGGS